jgi:hypothetical protein
MKKGKNKNCLNCGKELNGLKRFYCSNRCKGKYFYNYGKKTILFLFETHPELMDEWDYKSNEKNGLYPQKLTYGSRKRAFWCCSKNKDWKWSARIDSRTRVNRTNKCPYCSGKKLKPDGSNSLKYKFPDIAKEFHSFLNKEIVPDKITAHTDKVVYWQCRRNKDHIWKSSVSRRTSSNKQGCPFCYKKNEAEVNDLLNIYFSDWFIDFNKKLWHTYKDYKHKRYCDFYLTKEGYRDIMIEYDGRYHFQPIGFGCKNQKVVLANFKKVQIKDSLDTLFCRENNIILHRIKYSDNKEESIKGLKNEILLV